MATRQLSRELDGRATDVVVQTFADCIFVLVTQLRKVGTLIQASLSDTTPLPPPPDPVHFTLPIPPPGIQLTPLFGSTPTQHLQTLHSLYAAQIATIIWSHHSTEGSRRNIVVGLALRNFGASNGEGEPEYEKNVFQGVMTMVHEVVTGQSSPVPLGSSGSQCPAR